jgi:endo-1,4-beta-D-glucanase Y
MKMPFSLLAPFALLLLPGLLPSATAYPYPQNATYSFGLKATASAADTTAILAKYNAWKAAHVVSSGAGGFLRVQRTEYVGTGSMYDTVSEGIAYAMLLAVYFDDQTTFDQLFRYKTLHNDSNGLMNWRIDASGNTTGFNAATDSDTDIAYALYLASYQWGTSGTLGSYLTLANNEYLKIKQYEFNTGHVKPGDAFDSCRYPSYFFPNQYTVFSKRNPGDASFWSAITAQCYTTIGAVRNNTTGLLPETCLDNGPGGSCVDSTTQYLYNSCRVPWRIAMDYCYYGTANAQSHLNRTATWLQSTAPNTTGDGYNLDGTKTSNSNNAAFTGPFGCAFMAPTAGSPAWNQSQLNSYYASVLNMSFNGEYYNGALQLLTLLFMTGNMPNIADPAAIYTPTRTPTATPYAGTPTFTSTQTPVPSGLLFEDFETGVAFSPFSYGGPVAATSNCTFSTQFGGAQAGSFTEKLLVTTATGGYAGFGCQSNYANALGVVDATGAAAVTFWMKSDKAVTFQFSLHEGTTNGGDGENFVSKSQSCPGDNLWHYFELPTTYVGTITPGVTETFYLDQYSGSQTGGKVLNLASMKEVQVGFGAAIAGATVLLDQIGFKLSVAYTPTSTSTPFLNPYNQIFDDYESPLSLRKVPAPSMCDGSMDTFNAAAFGWSLSTNTNFGAQCGAITFTSGTTNSWGISAYEFSPYQTPAKFVDASGAVYLGMWLNPTIAGLRYQLAFQEANNTVVGADNEAWLSQISTLTTTGWQWVQFQVQTFKKDKYTGNQAGNNLKDLMAISTVSVKVLGNQGSGTLYVDNITFITSWKTPTPSASPSASYSPTFTPSETPQNFTATSTATRTATPSATPSRTPTASSSATGTPSQTRTVSDTPSITQTQTVALLSPTSTQTPLPSTATSTQTPLANTATSTATQVPFTATRTETVAVLSPTRTQTPLPNTATSTVTQVVNTATRTATPSATPSQTFSALSPTSTHTPLPFTFTNTVTITMPVPSATCTVTNVVVPPTSTSTQTQVVVIPPTSTSTQTQVVVIPPTSTSTQTQVVVGPPTATRTQTQVVAGPPTATATPVVSDPGTGGQGLGEVDKVVPVPNPIYSPLYPNRLYFRTTGPVDDVILKVYTRNMVCIGQANSGPRLRAGWHFIGIPGDAVASQPSGTLHFECMAKGQKTPIKKSLVLLK